jgi:exonuclease III
MPKILFWNIKARDLRLELNSLIDKYDPEIIILAESQFKDSTISISLNVNRESFFSSDINLSHRIKIYSKYGLERLKPVQDDEYFSIRELVPYLGPSLLIVGVHLPSKLHATPLDQFTAAQRLSSAIREAENGNVKKNTIVIGDFNMSPFEDGMVGASALHATLDRNIAKRQGRTVKKERYPFFYNPMWGRMGDLTIGPSGTHRYSKAIEVNHIWHTYDQVLIRPDLLDYFSPDDVIVPEQSGSDHFPIFINLRTETAI